MAEAARDSMYATRPPTVAAAAPSTISVMNPSFEESGGWSSLTTDDGEAWAPPHGTRFATLLGCDDAVTMWMATNEYTCESYETSKGLDGKCGDDAVWVAAAACRRTCWDAGKAYAGDDCDAARISQTVSTIEAGATYELTVFARSVVPAGSSATTKIRATLGSAEVSLSLDPVAGWPLEWVDGWPTIWKRVTVTFKADDAPELVGQPLTITLSSEEAGRVAFDHVSLTVDDAPTAATTTTKAKTDKSCKDNKKWKLKRNGNKKLTCKKLAKMTAKKQKRECKKKATGKAGKKKLTTKKACKASCAKKCK